MAVAGGVVAPDEVTAPVVRARALLDESERLWSADVRAAVHAAPSPGERHRRRLVVEALAAYERLRLTQAPSSDPATVFLRWPACTVVALSRDATQPVTYSTVDIPAERWSAGWKQACALLGLDLPTTSGPTAPDEVRVPELMLDPERGALVVTGGPGSTVTAAGGRPCVPDGKRWVVPRATPAVTCERDGEAYRLRVVDMADPLLLFTLAGTLLPLDRPLPPEEAWMVHYGPPAEGWYEGAVRILEHRPPPAGWSRWWLARVDLTDVTALRSAVDHGAGARHGPWHPVTSTTRNGSAVLEFGPALPGVTDPDGGPVYTAPPRLVLAGAATRWTVSITESGSGEAVSVSARGGDTVVLGEGLVRPLLGRYHVRAAGGGKPVVASFSVAEDVELVPSRRVRVLGPRGGLFSARITVGTPAGIRARPAVVRLGSHESDTVLTLHGHGRTVDLRVTLPHCAVREYSAAGHGPWRITPCDLDLTTAASAQWLDVRLPEELRHALTSVPALIAVDRAGAEVQEVVGGRVAGTDVQRYRLDRLADTVRSHGTVTLRLPLPGQNAAVAVVHGPPVEQPAAAPVVAEPERPEDAQSARIRAEVVAVIRSGLAARDVRQVADPAAVRTLWGMAPVRALLLTSPLLPYLADAQSWDLAELDDDERLLLGEVTSRCSPAALAVLAGVPLVREVRMSDALSPDGRALPGPRDLDLGPADADLVAHGSAGLPPDLGDAGDPSLTCALIARSAAHGDRAAAAAEVRIRPAWLRLAHRVPQLVGNDLVIAEFLVTRPRVAVGPARSAP